MQTPAPGKAGTGAHVSLAATMAPYPKSHDRSTARLRLAAVGDLVALLSETEMYFGRAQDAACAVYALASEMYRRDEVNAGGRAVMMADALQAEADLAASRTLAAIVAVFETKAALHG